MTRGSVLRDGKRAQRKVAQKSQCFRSILDIFSKNFDCHTTIQLGEGQPTTHTLNQTANPSFWGGSVRVFILLAFIETPM